MSALRGEARASGQDKVRAELEKLQIENEMLKTRLEISRMEQEIAELSKRQSVVATSRLRQTANDGDNRSLENPQRSRRNLSLPQPNQQPTSTPNVALGLNPEAARFLPTPHMSEISPAVSGYHPDRPPREASGSTPDGNDSVLKELVNLLSKSQDKLPRMEPEIFSGDIMQFPVWCKSFETLIENNVTSQKDRLYYLNKYTSSDAKTCIQGFLALNDDGAFSRAKETLIRRFGDKYRLAEAFKAKLSSWPTIKNGDGSSLQKLADFLQHVTASMATIRYLQSLDTAEENFKILRKLPKYISNRWNRIVDDWLHSTDDGQYPTFKVFADFINNEARIACGPAAISIHEASGSTQTVHRKKQTVFSTNTDKPVQAATEVNPQKQCFLCQGQHYVNQCDDFCAMDLEKRRELCKSKGLCYCCLHRGHRRADCTRKGRPLLYSGLPPKDEVKTVEATCQKVETANEEESMHSLIVPVIVSHVDDPNTQMKTYALLDNQSNSCFVADSIIKCLAPPVEELNLHLTTMLGTQAVASNTVKGLVIKGVNENDSISLPSTYTRQHILTDKSLVPRPETAQEWSHLRKIADKIHPYDDAIDIGLLVGFNCTAAIRPLEVVAQGSEDPYAVRTKLGWGIVGVVSKGDHQRHFAFRTHAREVRTEQVRQMYELEFTEVSGKPYSVEDQRFMKIIQENIKQKDDGHYELPLPFKDSDVNLPANRHMAEKRYSALQKKFKRNDKYRKDYLMFMENLISKGHAEIVPQNKTTCESWYIPHHGVYSTNKPDKLRVVFDCSAETLGKSLNQYLLQGPDQMNNLTGVLCRFRKERVAVACDIEGMFHQVSVKKEHRRYLRFLWCSDLSQPPRDYQMTVHLFGATSSPGCAMSALRATAKDHQREVGEEASNFVRRNFYVDDGLVSVSSIQEAADLVRNSIKLCGLGGFKLHKFVSNHREVLQEIPMEYRATNIQDVDLSCDSLPSSRTLGLEWSVENDEFQFIIQETDKPLSRRSILSTVSAIYDPLGLVSPFLLTGRKILQEICRDGKDWDEPLSDDIEQQWIQWTGELKELQEVRIPRCHKPDKASEIVKVELHHFSDASETGYGQCSYLRMIDSNGKVWTSLVMAKSRVTPSKPVTIPRLELSAAVLSVKISAFLQEELDYSSFENFYWTDSKIVLGYVTNESRRFHVFVANRIQQIRARSDPQQWFYVDSANNPADIASRGISAQQLKECCMWWYGPNFLQENPLPVQREGGLILTNDPEVKTSVVLATSSKTSKEESFISRLENVSSWRMMKNVIAICLRVMNWKRNMQKPENGPVTIEEKQRAEVTIIHCLQQEAFSCEIRDLKSGNGVKTSSRIIKLDPFLSRDGLLRVGGRIRRASLNHGIKHPVIIPQGHIANCLIAEYHEKCAHAGANTTLASLRTSGFWILNAKVPINSYVSKCVTCTRLRGRPLTQKMADLPADRMETAPPFTYSAVDLFGPFMIKSGRSKKKRWCALFVCLSSRAIHLEVVASLSTDSFINAYRRFVARRGHVRQLRCDRGTNFVGMKNEFNAEKVKMSLEKEDCQFDEMEFKMNFPHSSHMGGSWERMIRTARNALGAILVAHPGTLDDELLHTYLTEVEAVVNSRPLTTVTATEEPLSPAQLLTLKEKVILPPPGEFVRQDVYCRKRWRVVQYLANQFWQRWLKDFLPSLQERRKWHKTEANLMINDIVLVIDESLPRLQWKRGKIIEVFKSDDDLVRKVKVKVNNTELERPIHKLVLLCRPDQ